MRSLDAVIVSKAPADKQLAFMKEILPAFDAMPEIIPRYSWFAAHTKKDSKNELTDQLIDPDTNGTLTALGQFYNT